MKRIANACLEQTLVFSLKEKISPEADRKNLELEVNHYLRQLAKRSICYQLLMREEQDDGSIRLKIRKQYNNYPCQEYIAEAGAGR
ncbi:MAG: hypothetical protein E7324_04650 [Clostridiales bacterium]|nr:hypothetical protein [Clostridiales bacterium]